MEKLAIVTSTVSSKMLEAMAKAEGFRFVECLTGMLVSTFDLRIIFIDHVLQRFQVHRKHCPNPRRRRFRSAIWL